MINLTFETLEDLVVFASRVAVLGNPEHHIIEDPVPPIQTPLVQQTAPVQPPVQTPPPVQQPVQQPVQEPPVQPPVQQPPVQQPPVQQPVQTTAQEYVLDDIAKAAMTLMDKGMQGQLQELLNGYGVASLPELPKEQYGNFATALRGMGAQI